MADHAAIALFAACATWIMTWAVRRYALRTNLLDVPNERSSHTTPTPSSGGIAISVITLASISALWVASLVDDALLIASLAGGGAVALLGFIDDRRGLGPGLRFTVHVLAVASAVVLLGAAPLAAAGLPAWPVVVAVPVLVIAACWWINLFNFMDGIDGLAATEAAFIAASAAVLTVATGTQARLVPIELVVAAASIGFLGWNWPPARIFMGDVGSGFLGFMLALLALESSLTDDGLSIWTWVALGSLFMTDATVTLLRRALRGEAWYAAHRSHAYQHLRRRWASHTRVTLLYIGLNICFPLPLALLSVMRPALALPAACTALLITGVFVMLAGAGKVEAS